MRAWLLTNTTYGSWLPGSARGSVSSVRDLRPGDAPSETRFEHNTPCEPWETGIPALELAAQEQMRGPRIALDVAKAQIVLSQFQETAQFRKWILLAVSIMYNHWHLVVRVPDDPDPQKVLADFKAYASRALNKRYGEPTSGTWWTSKGSKRKLGDDRDLATAIHYVLHKQPHPLVVWPPHVERH